MPRSFKLATFECHQRQLGVRRRGFRVEKDRRFQRGRRFIAFATCELTPRDSDTGFDWLLRLLLRVSLFGLGVFAGQKQPPCIVKFSRNILIRG